MTMQMTMTISGTQPTSLDWWRMFGEDALGVVRRLGGDYYAKCGEDWANGDATILRNPLGHIYFATADSAGINWRYCADFGELRHALLERISGLVMVRRGWVNLSDEHLEQLIAEAVEVPMASRAIAGEDFVVYDTGRASGEQIVITPGEWTTVKPRFPFFHRDGNQGPSTLPWSAHFRVRECDQVIGCDTYTDNLVVWAALSGALDPSTQSPWLLYLGDKRQLRSQPLIWSKQILDPSTAPNHCPLNSEELTEQLDGQLIAAFDNVDSWSTEMVATLLKGVLNPDERDRRDRAVQPILAGERHANYPKDLLERCLPIRLHRTNFPWHEAEYCTESSFEEIRDALMGSLFNVLAFSMLHRVPVIDTKFPESLHPFVSHGRAVAAAMGLCADDFDVALLDSLGVRAALSSPPEDFVEPGLGG